jgi:hypothetical protein
MALVIKDRVKETTTTTGTGTVTLAGAVSGFQSFSAIGDGNATYYVISDPATGDWEVGIGTYTSSGTTLSRTTILSSSNAGSAVSFAAGIKDVFVSYPSSRAVYQNEAGNATVQGDFGTINATTANLTTATLTNGTISTTPSSANDITNKTYVDTLVASGIHFHQPVRVESPINLNATYNNGASGVGATLTNAGTQVALVIDGVTVSVADRVLIYAQSTQTQNGIYVVTSVGSGSTNWVLTRSSDADTYVINSANGLSEGSTVFVQEGSTGAGETYTCNTSGVITFGTTNITFAQISSAQIYSAGTGLTLSGTQFSITNTGTAGTYGSASSVPVFTTNAQGQVTSVTNTAIAITGAAVSGNIAGQAGSVANALTAGTYLTSGGTYDGSAARTFAVDATSANTASKVVARDSSGNFSAGTITATLSGAATSATTATNLAGGAANQIAYQTSSGTTNFAVAPTVSSTYLYWNGSALAWGAVTSGTVTSITAGTYLTGGTITTSGTIAVDATSANTASKVVARDASGNFSAGTITATLSGNATTASTAGSITSQANSATITASTSAGAANTIVLRDGNGYIFNNYFNSTDNSVASGVTAVMVKQGDSYLRSGTAASIATFISGQTMNINGQSTSLYAAGGGGIQSQSVGTSYLAAVCMREAPGGSGSSDQNYAPRLGFLWGGVVASSITVNTSGDFLFMDNPGTSYENVYAANIYSNGTQVVYNTGTWGINITGSAGSAGSVDFANLTNKGSGTGTYTTSGDYRAPIFYDANNTAYYGDFASTSNLNGILTTSAVSDNNNGLRNVLPGGGSNVTGTPTVTGAIVITLPTSSSPMVRFTVKVYTYDNLSFDVHCGGHTSSGTWYNTFAYMGTQNRGALNVRFCYGGGQLFVYIGELGTSWSYPQVFVTDVQVGYAAYSAGEWDNGWSISYNSSTYNNISSTHTVYPPTSSSNNTNPAYAGIYYDANDTSYYVDPNSNSRLVNLGLGGVTPDVRLSVSGDAHISSYLYMGGTAGAIGSWSSRLLSSGGATTLNTSTFTVDRTGYGGGSFSMDTAGNSYASASFRAPIFYDNDDTAFYTDPNSISSQKTILIGYSTSSPYVYGTGSTGYITFGTTSDPTNYSILTEMEGYNGSYSKLRLKWYTGIQYYAANVYGGHRFYDISGTEYFGIGAGSGANWSYSIYSHRAPIFYDYNDTNYYVDPASTSNLNNVQIVTLGVGTAASGTTGEIRATNNVTAYYSSDIKFKENVRDIPNAAATAAAIGGKLFDWTDAYIADHGGADGYFIQKEDFGVIAQDVQKAFPVAVRTRPDGSLAVDYEKLSALALAAVAELSIRVKSLEART